LPCGCPEHLQMRTERTLVTAVFGFEVESVIRHSGSFASAVREPFTILSLDVRPSEVSTLDDALEHFVTPEKVEYDEKQRTKNMRITSWPEILVIHLKRFFYDEKASMTNKVVKKIVYPEIFSVHVRRPPPPQLLF